MSETEATTAANYRAAVALNNVGALLIQKGMYLPACKTLRDAIAIMESLHSPTTAPMKTAFVEERLRRAATRLSQQSDDEKGNSHRRSELTYHQRQALPTIHLTNSSTGHPAIRIEVEYGFCAHELSEYDFLAETGIMVYNMAITTLCHFEQQQGEHTYHSRDDVKKSEIAMLGAAMKQLEVVRQLLSPLLCCTIGKADSEELEDDIPDLFATQLETLVLSQLVRVNSLKKSILHGENGRQTLDEIDEELRVQLGQNHSFLEDYGEYLFDQEIAAPAA